MDSFLIEYLVVFTVSSFFLLSSILLALYICKKGREWRERRKNFYKEDVINCIVEDSPNTQTKNVSLPCSNREIEFTELEKGEEIGFGAFGVVYKGKWRGQMVAIKELKKRAISEKELEQFKREASMMMIRASPNVITFFGICISPLAIVTEYMENGSVENMLKKMKKTNESLEQNIIIKMALDIAKGMLHLHKEKIIHRDLAARNLLLDKDNKVKIADFGLSRVMNSIDYDVTSTNGGPLKHMAPESLVQRKYSVHSDSWAYGITMIEIITREMPFPTMDAIQVAVGIVKGSLKPKPPDDCPKILIALLKRCFHENPSERPSFGEICFTLDETIGNNS